jgi:6-pyruvoyltetrahydropterin/6-carboxytetrahydropterin synthase
VDVWDHAFLVYKNDVEVLNFLKSLPNHKTVIFPSVPTAENMAAEAFRILKNQYKDTYGNHLKLERVRLFETPNSWADALS